MERGVTKKIRYGHPLSENTPSLQLKGPLKSPLAKLLKSRVLVAGLLTCCGLINSKAAENTKPEEPGDKHQVVKQLEKKLEKNDDEFEVDEALLPRRAPPILESLLSPDPSTDHHKFVTKHLNGKEIKFQEIKIKKLQLLLQKNIIEANLFKQVVDSYSTTKPPININFPYVTDEGHIYIHDIDKQTGFTPLLISNLRAPNKYKFPVFSIYISSLLNPIIFRQNTDIRHTFDFALGNPGLIEYAKFTENVLVARLVLPEHPKIANFPKSLVITPYTRLLEYELVSPEQTNPSSYGGLGIVEYGSEYAHAIEIQYKRTIHIKQGYPLIVKFDILEEVYKAMKGKDLKYATSIIEFGIHAGPLSEEYRAQNNIRGVVTYVRFYVIPANNLMDALKLKIEPDTPILAVNYVTAYNIVYVGELNDMLGLTRDPTLYIAVE